MSSKPQTTTPALYRFNSDREYFFFEGCHIIETLNDPNDPEVSIVRARVGPGVTTSWHRLRATTERYVILDGKGEAFVGTERFEVKAGDIVLIPPMVPQRIRNKGSSDLVFLAICSPRFSPEIYLEGR